MQEKTAAEIVYMRQAGQIVGSVLYDLSQMAKPGITPEELDQKARKLLAERGGEKTFLGFEGFPATICVSVNEAVVHGIPNKRPFQDGDIVGLDVGARVKGYWADAAVTLAIGKITPEATRLLKVTQQALEAGIERVRAGKHLGDIQAAIERVIRDAGLGIIRDLTGHGIGKGLHEPPEIPNFGQVGTGPILQPGMTICLEPMVTVGSPEVALDPDGWTIRTRDMSLGAQFEHTLLVTEAGAEILTPVRAWPKS